MTDTTIHMHKNDGLENYLKRKKSFFFFYIFTSGRFCLTPGNAGVGLHFREAPYIGKGDVEVRSTDLVDMGV